MDLLIQNLERRKKSGKFPVKFPFQNEGDFIVGEITLVTKNALAPEKDQFFVRSIKDGQEYSLPSNIVLLRLLHEQKAKEGDYVLVRYIGDSPEPSKKGNPTKLYEAAVVPKEEAEMILRGAIRQPEPEKVENPTITVTATSYPPVGTSVTTVLPAQPAITTSIAPPAPTEAKPKQATSVDPKAIATARNIVDFYGRISVTDLDRQINKVLGFNIPIDVLIKEANLKQEGESVTL
jgi:hypothetical protein